MITPIFIRLPGMSSLAMTCVAMTCVVVLWPATNILAATNELDDREITLAVETKLLADDAVPAHRIDVATQDGVVSMSGSVDWYYAKLRAQMDAESVKGVVAVVNNIAVRPFARLEPQVRADVISALAQDPVTAPFAIGVRVDDGIVTLSGEVDSYTEKAVAEQVASRIRGVAAIRNSLTYQAVADRADAEIQADVKQRLRADASVDSGLITVAVKDGTVTLGGSVASSAEKREAEAEARAVPGVKSVSSQLEVKWWLDGGTAEWGDGWTDSHMQLAIEDSLRINPRIESSKIKVSVKQGVATLSGTVARLQAKREAEEEALDVLGVWRVKNHLRVRPLGSRTDTAIANDVRDALRRNPYVDRYDIRVAVLNGKAYLMGHVDSSYMRRQAEDAAAGVLGVTAIQDDLQVDYKFTAKTDREIKDDIESQLWWSPFVDSDDIRVEVHSGVATLQGTVEDWHELQSARKNARDGGATAVINKLKIANGNGG